MHVVSCWPNTVTLRMSGGGGVEGAIIHVSVKIQSNSRSVSNSSSGWAFPRAADVEPGPQQTTAKLFLLHFRTHYESHTPGRPSSPQPFFCPRTESPCHCCLSNGSTSCFHKWPACAVCDRSLGLFLSLSFLSREEMLFGRLGNKFMSFRSKYMFYSSTSN